MADKYTIQVQPQISQSDASKMEKDLNGRFSNVAKKFGSHFKTAVKVGTAALAAGVVAALASNPFEKINEDLNNVLERFDNTATRAAQFGVSSGKFFQAEQIAASAGVKDLDPLLTRFAATLEQARTGEDSTLKQFLGKDVIDAFFEFSESLRKLAPDQRNAAVEQVFGERMGLRIAELLQTDVSERRKAIFGTSDEKQVTSQIDKLAQLEELQAIKRSRLAVSELRQKGANISEGTINAQNAQEKAKLSREAQQLSEYEIYAKQAMLQEKIAASLDEIRASVVSALMPAIQTIVGYLPMIVDGIKKGIEWLERIVAAIKKMKFWGS